MKTALYPGSFDPITCGHLNIIRRTAGIFDKLIVCVMVNAGKRPVFTLEERVEMIRKVTSDLPNVEVRSYQGLLADFACQSGSAVIIKGVRSGADFDGEFAMALAIRKLNPAVETLLIPADSSCLCLSSSMVKEMAAYGADLTGFIPEEIKEYFQKKTGGQL